MKKSKMPPGAMDYVAGSGGKRINPDRKKKQVKYLLDDRVHFLLKKISEWNQIPEAQIARCFVIQELISKPNFDTSRGPALTSFKEGYTEFEILETPVVRRYFSIYLDDVTISLIYQSLECDRRLDVLCNKPMQSRRRFMSIWINNVLYYWSKLNLGIEIINKSLMEND
jgi:glutaredoxin-related protein